MNEKKSVLIVEDEESLSETLGEKFEASGFEVFKGKNGEEGLDLALKNNPQIIVLDIIMPKMDGITMLKKLREDEKGKNVPVILLTNISDTEKIDEAVSLGIEGYLLKADWKLKDIVERVNKVMERKSKEI